MKYVFILLGAAAMTILFTPASSNAQGVGIDVPGIGVRIGDPDHRRYHEDREFRERQVRSGQRCRTVTIRRDDGMVRRARRCD